MLLHPDSTMGLTVVGDPPPVRVRLVEPGAPPDLHLLVLLVLPVDRRLEPILDADVEPSAVGGDQLLRARAQAEDLLDVHPDANTASDQSAHFLGLALADIQTLEDHLKEVSKTLAKTLKEQHTRVRQVAKITGQKVEILPQGAPDILGIYVILPV